MNMCIPQLIVINRCLDCTNTLCLLLLDNYRDSQLLCKLRWHLTMVLTAPPAHLKLHFDLRIDLCHLRQMTNKCIFAGSRKDRVFVFRFRSEEVDVILESFWCLLFSGLTMRMLRKALLINYLTRIRDSVSIFTEKYR